MEPDHFYLATFYELETSQTTDTEPRYETHYTIQSGPYRSVQDAWEDGILEEDQWDIAVVLGYKGVDAVAAYHEIGSEIPTEDALDKTNAEWALFER